MEPYCVLSSFVFSTNCIGAFAYGEYIYGVFFGALCISSIIFHGVRYYNSLQIHPSMHISNNYLFIVDKLFILLVVGSGGYIFYKKSLKRSIDEADSAEGISHVFHILISAGVISTFILTLILYYYGYMYSVFCYDPREEIQDKYHSLLHYISSIGHHCILLL